MDLGDAIRKAGASGLVMAPGDVCLVNDEAVVIPETPEEKRTYHKDGRPCVILFNHELCAKALMPIVSVAPISHRVDLKDACDFPISPNARNGLHQESLVMLGHIQPVRKNDVFKKIGSLANEEFDGLMRHLVQNIEGYSE